MEALRGYNNLGTMFIVFGDARRAGDKWSPGWELANRYRGSPNARWLQQQRFAVAFGKGNWDESLRLGEEFVAEVGPSHYAFNYFVEIRGRIRLARGDLATTLEDSEADLARSRPIKDPQRIQAALAFRAFVLLTAGRVSECEACVDELLTLDPFGAPIPHFVAPVLDLAWILTRLGREDKFLAAAASAKVRTKWLEAATAFARGEVELAADICAEIGVLPNEAYTRLRAAEKLVLEGRRADADAQLRRALEFYRSVGASFFIREAEALMAESA
jgi:tetratricopeptide (TPR) repeat protein